MWFRRDLLIRQAHIYLCDMCIRVSHYTDAKTAPLKIVSAAERREAFGCCIATADQSGTVCNEQLTTVDSLATVQILS
jgi:hypothetical protein